MRIFIKRIVPLLAAAAMITAFAGCRGKLQNPKTTAKPSASPVPTETAGPSASPSAEATADPSGTEGAAGDTIEGFMEGMVLSPDDVPELTKRLSEKSGYEGMTIQSVTYKLYEGRQAYYVVLQDEGEASRPVYVFADGSVIEE